MKSKQDNLKARKLILERSASIKNLQDQTDTIYEKLLQELKSLDIEIDEDWLFDFAYNANGTLDDVFLR